MRFGLLDWPPRLTRSINEKAIEIQKKIRTTQIGFPWQCMYEVVSTRLVKRHPTIRLLERYLSMANVATIDDSTYKIMALEHALDSERQQGSHYSLVDCVVREILKDKTLNIRYFVTFNKKDFVDLCARRKIEMLE